MLRLNATPVLVLAVIGCLTPCVRGGMIITANLPDNTAIINISGTQDGAATFNSNQSEWYQPFNTTGNLLEIYSPSRDV